MTTICDEFDHVPSHQIGWQGVASWNAPSAGLRPLQSHWATVRLCGGIIMPVYEWQPLAYLLFGARLTGEHTSVRHAEGQTMIVVYAEDAVPAFPEPGSPMDKILHLREMRAAGPCVCGAHYFDEWAMFRMATDMQTLDGRHAVLDELFSGSVVVTNHTTDRCLAQRFDIPAPIHVDNTVSELVDLARKGDRHMFNELAACTLEPGKADEVWAGARQRLGLKP